MTTIARQIVEAIHRNNSINIVIVSKVEWLLIKREIGRMAMIKREKRPTYGPPYGDLDRMLWDNNFKIWRDYAAVSILGRPVIYRSVGK